MTAPATPSGRAPTTPSGRAPHTARLRALVANAMQNRHNPRLRCGLLADIDTELATLRGIEHAYAELVAEADEQLLLAEPVAGRA